MVTVTSLLEAWLAVGVDLTGILVEGVLYFYQDYGNYGRNDMMI